MSHRGDGIWESRPKLSNAVTDILIRAIREDYVPIPRQVSSSKLPAICSSGKRGLPDASGSPHQRDQTKHPRPDP